MSKKSKSTLEEIAILKGHTSSVLDIVVDDTFIYSSSIDNTVRVWRKGSWKLVSKLMYVFSVLALSIDDQYIYSGSDKIVYVTEKRSWEEVAKLYGHMFSIFTITSDNNYIYSGAGDGIIRVWRKKDWKLKNNLKFHSSRIYALAVDKKYIFSGSDDCSLCIWKKEKISSNINPIKVIDFKYPIRAIVVDDLHIYLGSGYKIHVIQKNTMNEIIELKNQWDTILSIAVDNDYIYSGTSDGLIIIWDKKNFKLHAKIQCHRSRINSVAVDKNYVYSSSSDGTIRVWDKSKITKILYETK